jgi:hypothetical protein
MIPVGGDYTDADPLRQDSERDAARTDDSA